ncbi:SH3 domain-containing protein [Clostridium massiliamazoniense]|uniref:SH3 domain-containing protein n=1 Tax=Clostridium massiliamazoniense TaxID=1347366 RepID=UPI0006D7A4B1|nr:SH3 domain-containing protein [Clostridium massiliamazoniense]
MKRTNILGILGAATLLSGVAFSAVPSITATASPAQQNVRLLANRNTKVVTANGLNVRAKASINSSRLGILPKGSKVEVIGQEGNWSKIMYNGKVAYVASSYLANGTSGTSTSQAKPQGTSQKAKVVTANGLNVRAKASINSSRLGILPKGSKVEVIGQEGNWSKIMYNGKVAYVASSYLANGTSGTSTSQAKPQGTSQKAKVVTANGLNVRAKASVNSSRLGILPKGSKVEVIGQEGNWSKIMYNGKVAFVSATYLK